ncbi:MAG: HPF/RaiA family ribosome-associated protein [Rhodothermales bacterium]
MQTIAFDVEYHSDTEKLTNALKAKVERRLEKLAHRHHDITGASLAVQTVSGANRKPDYKVRLVLYHRPDNIAAIRKNETVANALMEALDAVERQVREHRERLHARTRRRQTKA